MGSDFFGLLSMVGALGLGFSDTSWAWTTWFLSFSMIFVCLTLFGLLTRRQKLLPRWNALPVIAGIGFPLYVMISIIWETFIDGWFSDQGIGLLILLITAVSIGLLGFTLQGDSLMERAAV